MAYNIHPLFVHFPIAFLLLYSLLKTLPFERLVPRFAWREVQLVVLVFGVLGAIVASATGEISEHLIQPDRQIVEMHSLFAATSTWIYGLLLLGELLTRMNPWITRKFPSMGLPRLFRFLESTLTNRVLSVVFAIVGLLTISLIGLLGGVMVYGASADPLVPSILKLLGIK